VRAVGAVVPVVVLAVFERSWAAGAGPHWREQVSALGRVPIERPGEHYGVLLSPDLRRVAYVDRRGKEQAAVIDGREDPVCDSVGRFTFSPNGARTAYVATRDGAQSVVVDGRRGIDYEGIFDLVFSPDSANVVYMAKRKGREVVVLNGKEGPSFDGIGGGSLVVSPDSRHVAYGARRGPMWFAVIDGREGPAHTAISRPGIIFSPDGARVAYAAIDGGQTRAVIDGVPGPAYDGILSPGIVFSPDTKHTAYVAKKGGTSVVIVDERAIETDSDVLEPGPRFSPDSSHVAYRARSGAKQFVVLDGRQGPIFDKVDGLLFSPRAARLAYSATRTASPQHRVQSIVIDGREMLLSQWYAKTVLAFSPDGRRFVHVVNQRDEKNQRDVGFLVDDGRQGPVYDQIKGRPTFSPDGSRLAYVARKDWKWRVVVNGVEGPAFYNIGEGSVTFSPDSAHLAYTAWRAGKWRLVIDDREVGSEWTAFVKGAVPVFDSATHAHVLVRGEPASEVSRVDIDLQDSPEGLTLGSAER
jgi:Tol biopolymer transport system component